MLSLILLIILVSSCLILVLCFTKFFFDLPCWNWRASYTPMCLICYQIWYIYIYISWPTVVEGDLKAPFSIATTLKCRGGCYSFPCIASLTLDPYLIMLLSKAASSTIFWVFGITWPGIEPHSSRPLAKTLTITYIFMMYVKTFSRLIWIKD